MFEEGWPPPRSFLLLFPSFCAGLVVSTHALVLNGCSFGWLIQLGLRQPAHFFYFSYASSFRGSSVGCSFLVGKTSCMPTLIPQLMKTPPAVKGAEFGLSVPRLRNCA